MLLRGRNSLSPGPSSIVPYDAIPFHTILYCCAIKYDSLHGPNLIVSCVLCCCGVGCEWVNVHAGCSKFVAVLAASARAHCVFYHACNAGPWLWPTKDTL